MFTLWLALQAIAFTLLIIGCFAWIGIGLINRFHRSWAAHKKLQRLRNLYEAISEMPEELFDDERLSKVIDAHTQVFLKD